MGVMAWKPRVDRFDSRAGESDSSENADMGRAQSGKGRGPRAVAGVGKPNPCISATRPVKAPASSRHGVHVGRKAHRARRGADEGDAVQLATLTGFA